MEIKHMKKILNVIDDKLEKGKNKQCKKCLSFDVYQQEGYETVWQCATCSHVGNEEAFRCD
jgi:hypothetical protein